LVPEALENINFKNLPGEFMMQPPFSIFTKVAIHYALNH
jgi:hypothetical protein